MRVDESSNSHSHLTANSHGLSSILERSHQLWTHVCSATLINCHGFSFSFDRAHESWTKLSPKSGHSTLIQLSSSFDCVHESLNSHATLILFDRALEIWTKVSSKPGHSTLIQLSSSFDCVHESWTKLSPKSGHSVLIQLSSSFDRAHESQTKLSSKSGQLTLIQLSFSFDCVHESWTKLSPKSGHSVLIQLSSWLVWPRAWELDKTLIQIWSLNSCGLSFSFDYVHESWTNVSSKSGHSINSHTTLILIWLRALELNKTLIQTWSLNSHACLMRALHNGWNPIQRFSPNSQNIRFCIS